MQSSRIAPHVITATVLNVIVASYAFAQALPYSGSLNSSSTAFAVTNTGSGTGVQADGTTGNGLIARTSGSNSAIWARNLSSGPALTADATSGVNAIFGNGPHNGVCGRTSSATDSGLLGINDNAGYGVYGSSTSGIGTYGITTSTVARTPGVYGKSTAGNSSYPVGVYGQIAGSGTYSSFTEHPAGVYGKCDGTGVGVQGTSYYGTGVFGTCESGNCVGVYARCQTADCVALNVGTLSTSPNTLAGQFWGNVKVFGNITTAGKAFLIDHPLDPENKVLYHASIESDEYKNLYDGVTKTDETGTATVRLPDWFQALNTDYRYQLTVIGSFARAIIESEIEDNRFVIRTDEPFTKVSWQVTGNRHDPYAAAHPVVPEQDKPKHERGKYLYPVEYGVSPSLGVAYPGVDEGQGAFAAPADPAPLKDTYSR